MCSHLIVFKKLKKNLPFILVDSINLFIKFTNSNQAIVKLNPVIIHVHRTNEIRGILQ